MADNFKFGIDFDLNGKLSASAINSIKNQIKSIGPVNIPIKFVGAGGAGLSSAAKSIDEIGSAMTRVKNNSSATGSAISNVFDKVKKGSKDATSGVKNLNQELELFGKQAASTVRRFSAFVLVVSAFNNLTNAISSSFSKAVQFEKEITKVSQVTGTAYAELRDLTGEITRLATTFGVSSEKIGNVALTLAQAGLTAEDTKKALDVLAKTELSATFEDIGQTTEAAIAIMAQFGTKTEDLAGQLGAMNSVAAKFAVESGDLATAIRRTGGAFQATGGDLNELLALFTSVRATTRESAESISTGLRTIFTRLQRTRTLNFLDDLGISLREVDKDGRTHFIGIYRSIEKLSEALKDIKGNDPRFNQIVEELGGFRQVSKVIPLLKEFELTQKALNVAKRSGNSIDRDAITAQQTLANQIARVGQEFDALIRKYLDDAAIRVFIQTTLNLASALIKVGDAIRPLIPLLSVLGANSLFNAGSSIAKGFAPSLFKGAAGAKGVLGFNRGGAVPGSGNGDTVPAMLEPGEFVVKKSAVNAFGAENLAHINKYAVGGRIGRIIKFLKDTRARSIAHDVAQKGKGFFGDVSESDSLKNQVVIPFGNLLKSGASSVAGVGRSLVSGAGKGASVGGGILGKIGAGVKAIPGSVADYFTPAPPLPPTRNRQILNSARAILRDLQKEYGIKLDKSLVNRLVVTSNIEKQTGGKSNTPITNSSTSGFYSRKTNSIVINSGRIKNKKDLELVLLHELSHAIDSKLGTNGLLASRVFPRGLGAKIAKEERGRRAEITARSGFTYSPYKLSPEELFADSFSKSLVSRDKKEAVLRILSKVKAKAFAKGGANGTDTQPALLTPGEYVINKRSAQAFGYHNLEKVNKYATGGRVGAGTVGAALAIGPSLLEQFSGASEGVKPFLNALTVAGASLLTFSFAIKRGTEESQGVTEEKFAEHQAITQEIRALEKKNALIDAEISKQQSRTIGNTDQIGPVSPGLINKRDKNSQAQKGLSERQAALRKEINDVGDAVARDAAFNKIASKIAIGSAVAAGVGSIFSSFSQESAIKGQKTTLGGLPTVGTAAVGGGLSGAATGALLGLSLGKYGGPYGAAIGAVGGGIFGAARASSSAQSALKQFELSDSVSKLNKILVNIESGKTTIGVQRGNIRSRVEGFNKEFLSSSPEELQTFKAQVESSITGLEGIFSEATKGAKTLQEFREKNEDLILVLSRFGGQTIPELEKQVEDAIKNQSDQNKITKEATKNAFELESVFKIAGAIGDAERSAKGFADSLESLDNIISGTFGASKFNQDFSALGNVGNSRLSDVTLQARQAGALIGGPGKNLAEDVIQASALVSRVPALLNESVNGKQLEGDDIRDKFSKSLGGGFAARLILEAVNKEIGNTGSTTELIKKFGEDPVGLTKRIQSAVDPIINALKDEAPRITEQFNLFTEGLATVRKNNVEILSRSLALDDLGQLRTELNASAFGRTLSPNEALAGENAKLARVTGGKDIGQLGLELNGATRNIQTLQAARANSTNRDEIIELTKQIETNIQVAEESTTALEYLADVNGRLAVVEKERQKLQQTRENKGNLAKEFVFGDPAAQRDIFKGLVGVKTILGNLNAGKANPLEGLNKELKTLSLGILEQFSSDKLFQGKTGQEIINDVISKDLGIDFGKPQGEEAKLLNLENQIINASDKAQTILITNLQSNNKAFLDGLVTNFDSFFVNLTKVFADREAKAKQDVDADKAVRRGRIDEQINTLKLVGQSTGLDINDPKSIDATRSTIEKIKTARAAQAKANEIEAAKKDYLAGKGTAGLERVLGSNFLKELGKPLTKEQLERRGGPRNFLESAVSPRAIQSNLIDKKAKEERESAAKTFKEAEDGIGRPINGIIGNLKALEKGLEDITTKTSLNELEKQKLELRAGGGMVWQKRGTDTVPAMTTDGQPFMLTPGEMVMNRRAVGKYGPELKKMNYAAKGRFVDLEHEKQMISSAGQSNRARRISTALAMGLPYPELDKKGLEYRDVLKGTKAGIYLNNNGTTTEGTHNRIVQQSRRFNESMRRSELTRGIVPDSDGTRKFGQFDPTRTKGPSGNPVSRGRSVPSLNDYQESRAIFQHNSARAVAFRAQKEQEKYERNAAWNQKNNPTGNPFIGTLPIGPKIPANNKLPAGMGTILGGVAAAVGGAVGGRGPGQNNPIVNPAALPNPKVMEEFNNSVNKLVGAKLELAISGTVDVRIIEGNMSKSIEGLFQTAVQAYVDNKVTEAINTFANQNGLPSVPKPVGVKSVEKK